VTSDEAVIAVIEALEAVRVPYMLVGSLASNLYGIVRSTKDADFVVQCRAGELNAVARHLGRRFKLDPQLSFESVTATTRCVVELTESAFRIEFFLLSDDAHDRMRFERRRELFLPQLNRRVFVPTAEDVIVTKLRWALHARRRKDSDDARDVIAVQGGNIDWEYVYRWCDAHGTRELLEQLRGEIPPI
jgi:hypothetical protein